MKKTQNSTAFKLIKKFDNQLHDILAAELRSIRYAKNKIMEQFLTSNLISVPTT